MKNKLLLNLVICTSLAMPITAQTTTCSEILGDDSKQQVLIGDASKIKDPELLYKVKIKNDTRFTGKTAQKEDLLSLFQMLGRTQFFNASEKITLEKGTLYLGQKIDDFLSLQAEYTFDKPNKKLHMTRLSVVNSKNGQEQILTKEPVDYMGGKFAKSDFNLIFEKDGSIAKVVSNTDMQIPVEKVEVAPASFKSYSLNKEMIHNAETTFPTVIQGAAFEKVLKWSKVVPHLDHVEINVVDTVTKQNWTIAKGQFRRFMEFAKDRFFKQAFGLIVVYAIFDGISNFGDDVAKYIVHIAQEQQSSISVKVKETKVDGQVINTEQKFKISLPKKKDNDSDTDGDKK